MLTLILPTPPSANRYWASFVPKGAARANVYVTKEALAYKTEVAWLCQQAGIREPLRGRLAMEVDLYPHRPIDWQKRVRGFGADLWDDSVQSIDLGNCEKVLSDALQGPVMVDDKQLWRITLARMEPDEGGARVVVRLAEMPPHNLPPPLLGP